MQRNIVLTVLTVALAATADALVHRKTYAVVSTPKCGFPGYGGASGTFNCAEADAIQCRLNRSDLNYNTCQGQEGYTNSWQAWAEPDGVTCDCYYW